MPWCKQKAATLLLITQNFNTMPYGKGGRLGESIDPRLMQADYSGFANAGMIQGQALANMGAQIGDVIKQRGEEEKFIKKSEKMAQDIADLIPELAPQANAALAALNDPDASRRDRMAMAESIKDTMQVGILGLQQKREQEMLDLKRQSMMAKGGSGAMNPASIRATLDLLKASGYEKQAESLAQSFAAASTPQEAAAVANLIAQVGGSIGISKLGVSDTGSTAYKISGTPSMVPKGDKKVAEWKVTAPDGREFTVNAEQKKRLNRAIQLGQPFDIDQVLEGKGAVSRAADFVRGLLSGDVDQTYGVEAPKTPRITSLEERERAYIRLTELKEKAANGDSQAAIDAAALENALKSGGIFGQMEFTDPAQLLGNPFE